MDEEYVEVKKDLKDTFGWAEDVYMDAHHKTQDKIDEVKADLEGKPAWKSKTLWLNVLAMIAIGMTAFGYGELEIAGIEGFGLALLNMLNRFGTTKPLK